MKSVRLKEKIVHTWCCGASYTTSAVAGTSTSDKDASCFGGGCPCCISHHYL